MRDGQSENEATDGILENGGPVINIKCYKWVSGVQVLRAGPPFISSSIGQSKTTAIIDQGDQLGTVSAPKSVDIDNAEQVDKGRWPDRVSTIRTVPRTFHFRPSPVLY